MDQRDYKAKFQKKMYKKLDEIMVSIHTNAHDTAERYGKPGNYVFGANIAGFLKVAEAMHAQGVGVLPSHADAYTDVS